MNRSEVDPKQGNNALLEHLNLARFLKLMGTGGDGKAMRDELARVEREIAACERGNYDEGPLWLDLFGWTDWQLERQRRLVLRGIPEPAVPA